METFPSQPSIDRQVHNNSLAPSLQATVPPARPTAWTEPPKDELDLRQLFAMLRRRSLMIAGVVVTIMAFTIGYTLAQKQVYAGRFRMLVEPVNRTNSSLSGLPYANDPSQSSLDYATQIQVLLNPTLIASTIDELKDFYPDLDYTSLVENLTIEQLKETKILEVRYQSQDQGEVTAVLEQLSEDFLQYSQEERQTNLRQGIDFIQKQLPETRNRVDQLQRELQVFRQQNAFIDPGTQNTQIANQSGQLEGQRLSLDQSLAQARSSLSTLQIETGTEAALNNAPVYQQLVGQLRQVETEIATELTRFGDEALAIQILREKRANLLPLLQEEAQRVVGGRRAEVITQIQILEAQRQAIAQAQVQVDQKTQQLPILIRRYTDLQRELEVATASLDRFLTALESLQIEASQTEIPWQIVQDPVLFPDPISPSIKRNVILGVLASVTLGFGLALLVEKLDDVYHDLEELKAKTKLPLLGTIPFQKQLEEIEDSLMQERKPLANQADLTNLISAELSGQPPILQPISQGSSKFLSALQVLCTKIQLLNPEHPVRSIVVTSPIANDGKTTIALYLAQTAAEMGQRVLLVDADLRQARLQNRLNLGNPHGLTHLIAQNLPLYASIYQPLQEPGFFFLPAGEIPPNPAKFLSARKMQQVEAEVSQFFDLIIYDVPAMDGVADATLLAPHTDGIVLVVRMGKTERFDLAQTLENLKMSQMPILGIVANDV